jgi:hypothetical protein
MVAQVISYYIQFKFRWTLEGMPVKRKPMKFSLFLVLSVLAPGIAFAQQMDERAADYYNKAVDAVRREDFDGAKLYLQEVLSADRQCAEAIYLRGLIRYHDHDIAGGNADIEEAYKLKPSLRKDRSDRLEKRAHSVEAHLTDQTFAHFNLEFMGAERRDDAWEAVQYLNGMYDELGSRFGVFPEGKFTIIVFTSEEFIDVWRAPFIGGFFDRQDGKVRLCVPSAQDEFRHRARHEFTHAFLHRLYSRELPSWFTEGTAEFYAFENPTSAFWIDDRLDAIRRELKQYGAPWMTMADVDIAILKKEVHPAYIYFSYKESEALVLYTAKARGESWIPNLYRELRAGKSFEQAYESVVGHPPSEMLADLHRSWQ